MYNTMEDDTKLGSWGKNINSPLPTIKTNRFMLTNSHEM